MALLPSWGKGEGVCALDVRGGSQHAWFSFACAMIARESLHGKLFKRLVQHADMYRLETPAQGFNGT
jgi:hypothetical protein